MKDIQIEKELTGYASLLIKGLIKMSQIIYVSFLNEKGCISH